MEVFCPCCSMGYRIPTHKLPKRSRILMCKSCGTAWRQHFPPRTQSPHTRVHQTVETLISSPRPKYSQGVLDILREEAALEVSLRKA